MFLPWQARPSVSVSALLLDSPSTSVLNARPQPAAYLEYIQHWKGGEPLSRDALFTMFEPLMAPALFSRGVFDAVRSRDCNARHCGAYVSAATHSAAAHRRTDSHESCRIILDRLRQDAAIHQPRVELVWCGLIMLAWLGEFVVLHSILKV